MKSRISESGPSRLLGVAATALLVSAGAARSATYDLKADAVNVTMPGGEVVAMWGFGPNPGSVTVPGPALVVPPGDSTLTINLTNDLPTEPVSIVLPGQAMPVDCTTGTLLPPAFFYDAGLPGDPTAVPPVPATPPRRRVRSFTAEAAPGGTQCYQWNGLTPGTYFYQSGTHPGVQVQMGLYGAASVQPAVGEVYPGVAYADEVILVLSELDPAVHAAVASGNYGPGLAVTSPVNYHPKYFLVNGVPYAPGSSIAAGNAGDEILVRFLNAGLRTHSMALFPPTPSTGGVPATYFTILAEDGKPYPYTRQGYSVYLPAGKTIDALVAPSAPGKYMLQDRTLHVTNGNAVGDAGLQAALVIGGSAVPVADNDYYTMTGNTTLTIPAPGVLGNDSGPGPMTAVLVTSTTHGSLSLASDGSFSYTPNSGYAGNDVFSYKANNGTDSNVAQVTITVSLPPVAMADSYSLPNGTTLNVAAPGILGNDSSPSGKPLTAALGAGTANGTLTLSANGSFTYVSTSNTAPSDSFTYTASDGTSTSAPATVTLTLTGHPAPVARDDTFSAPKRTGNSYTPVVLNVWANDTVTGPGVTLVSTTLKSKPSRGGTATVNPNGTISYTPKKNFVGSDVFTYTVTDSLNAVSNIARVTVNVQ
jgi:hypothetical protein